MQTCEVVALLCGMYKRDYHACHIIKSLLMLPTWDVAGLYIHCLHKGCLEYQQEVCMNGTLFR